MMGIDQECLYILRKPRIFVRPKLKIGAAPGELAAPRYAASLVAALEQPRRFVVPAAGLISQVGFAVA
jgi:hypothetical protein